MDNDLPHLRLPGNINFIISATYSLNNVDSPVNFTDLSKLTMQDILLNSADVVDYLNLWLEDPTVGPFFNDPAIRAMVSVNCGGVPEKVQRLIVRDKAITLVEANLSSEEGRAAYRQLIRSGINSLIFPHRSLTKPLDAFWLVENAIQRMSGTALRSSLVDPMNDFQSVLHHILAGL
eukprot:gene31769-41233_t